MNVSELTLRLLLLFFPGIICFYMVDALVVHRERKVYQVFLLAYIYGLLSYTLYAAIHACYTMARGLAVSDDGSKITAPVPNTISFARSLAEGKTVLDFHEIAGVTVISTLVALALAVAINRSWFHKLARRLGVSRKFGVLDVWVYAFDAPEVRWATVRDLQHNFMFTGYIRAFSDVEPNAELVLTDVVVYNEATGAQLYEADRMYLSRKKDDITIEFPKI